MELGNRVRQGVRPKSPNAPAYSIQEYRGTLRIRVLKPKLLVERVSNAEGDESPALPQSIADFQIEYPKLIAVGKRIAGEIRRSETT